ncbi:hypothetical protein BT69DRAFT_761168 [Atractiella rhizophila]|nr:hypothetical protein BT69DRAFT_761168 [Atractiella rhizophila]
MPEFPSCLSFRFSVPSSTSTSKPNALGKEAMDEWNAWTSVQKAIGLEKARVRRQVQLLSEREGKENAAVKENERAGEMRNYPVSIQRFCRVVHENSCVGLPRCMLVDSGDDMNQNEDLNPVGGASATKKEEEEMVWMLRRYFRVTREDVESLKREDCSPIGVGLPEEERKPFVGGSDGAKEEEVDELEKVPHSNAAWTSTSAPPALETRPSLSSSTRNAAQPLPFAANASNSAPFLSYFH